jgi:hypothetical protein
MAAKTSPPEVQDAKRKERLAAALRENLKRRKAQARGRKDDKAEPGPEPEGRERG